MAAFFFTLTTRANVTWNHLADCHCVWLAPVKLGHLVIVMTRSLKKIIHACMIAHFIGLFIYFHVFFFLKLAI